VLIVAALLFAARAPAQPEPNSSDLDVSAEAPGDDEVLIIEDDEDDDVLIIEEEEGVEADPTPTVPAITGALGRLWEAWHVAADSDAAFSVQAVPQGDGPWRLDSQLALQTWLLPAPNLGFYAGGFGHLSIDGTPEGRVLAWADVYDAYAKVNAGVGSVQLGRLVVPWAKTRVAALSDRLNPPDQRRGLTFPDPAQARQPQWGATARTSLGALSLEGVLFVAHEPSEGALAASEQGGTRLARYQSALVRSPARVGGLLADYDRTGLLGNPTFVDGTTVAVRARRRLGDFDLGGSAMLGLDDVPSLQLRPEVARFLSNEVRVALGGVAEPYPCDPAISESSCLGGRGTLHHARTASLSGDITWGLGIVILRAELFAQPRLGAMPGKTVLLVDVERGLMSDQLSHYAASVAVEGALGDWMSGSVEVFDSLWTEVPRGARLYGVELLEDERDSIRAVHRLAVGASLAGSLWAERFDWHLRGEGGILQRDVLLSARVRYRLPVFNLYVGGHGDVFAGLAGSPGWMRQDASRIGIFLGEGA
jgi:hypothetical protein